MASRMDKYYEEVDNKLSRSERNKENYKKMYEDEEYSNIEGVLTTSKKNEIDIEKLKKVLEELEQKEESKNHIVKDIKVTEPDTSFLDDETKTYDIMDILNKAKEENKNTREKKYYRLDDELVDDLKNPVSKVEKIPLENDLNEIKELLNTITNTMDLSKLKDSDLSLDVLEDLKTETELTKDTLIRSVLEDAKKEEKKVYKKEEQMDNTFNTKSIKLGKKDYVENVEDLDEDEKQPLVIRILKILLLVLFIAGAIYLGYIFIK